MGNKTGMLACTMERDPETNLFVAHCLNHDIIESGRTEEEAWQRLKAVVKAHVEHCYAYYREGLDVTASRQEWAEYAKIVEAHKGSIEIDEITIELRAPLADQVPIWMQRVFNGEREGADF